MASPASVEDVTNVGAIKLGFIVTALCLAVLLTGMDQTILAAAAPTISNEFASLGDISWWTNAYILTLSSFQLFYGKLYSLFSIKLVYITAIALFEIGSLICTTAPNSTALIFGRAIAGLGASGIFSGGVLITTKVIPLSRRPAYLGLMSAVFGVAAIAGPFVGGALADKSTWRWCFGINLPLGAFTIGVCIWFVQTPAEPNVHPLTFKQKVHQLDIPGMVVAIAGVICLLLGLQWGGGTYPWDNGRVIALLTVSGILLAAFVAMQTSSRVSKLKTIPESITKSYNIWLAASYAMGITSGIYVVMVYLPIWFQVIRGRSALSSGILLTPTIAGYVVASVLAGAATSAIGYYNPPMLLGTALIIPGAALLTTLTPGTSTARIIGFEILYGLGAGFGFGQPMYIVQTLLPEADVPIGVTFITLVQNLTASIFVAMGQSIFQNTLRKRLIHIVPPELMQELLRGGAAAVHDFVPETQRSDALMAYSDALIRTLYITLGMGCATIVGAVAIRWTSMKSSKPEEGNPPNPPLEQTTQEREKLHNAP